MAHRNRFLLAFLALPMMASCAGVLGIDKAELESTSTGGAAGAGGAADAGGGVPKDLCGDYCAAVKKNCSGDFELYTSLEVCLTVCTKLPLGTRDDTTGNTVGCRLHYASEIPVIGEKETNCPAAGPGGNGVCGDNCDGFCSITQASCVGKNVQYATLAECTTACKTVPDPGGYDDSIQTGNSMQCRLYHASAASFDPVVHCPHTDIGPLGTPCAAVATPATP